MTRVLCLCVCVIEMIPTNLVTMGIHSMTTAIEGGKTVVAGSKKKEEKNVEYWRMSLCTFVGGLDCAYSLVLPSLFSCPPDFARRRLSGRGVFV